MAEERLTFETVHELLEAYFPAHLEKEQRSEESETEAGVRAAEELVKQLYRSIHVAKRRKI